jgi:hypothetical protein
VWDVNSEHTPTGSDTDSAHPPPDVGRVTSSAALEHVRDGLLERLHARSADFAATEELQAVGARLWALAAPEDPDRAERLRRSGMSFFDRLRSRRRGRLDGRG